MTDTNAIATRGTAALIRNEPVQARSTARLAALLDAAAQVVDEIGYERLTTAMVADRAGASIGTVYRYFPDRIAVLQSLAARNFERVAERAVAIARSTDNDSWVAAMGAVYAMLVDAFRTEPGFASIRLGDVLDLRPAEGTPMNTVVADRLFDALVERFGLDVDDEARLAFQAAIEVTDALIARAFATEPDGDEHFIERGREIVRGLIEPHLG